MDAGHGSNVPTPEERLRQLLALAPVTACHIDGDAPWGTDHGVLGVQDEHDRICMTHAAASEHGKDARQCRQRGTALGLPVPAACSDDSHSCTAAIKVVWPPARLQADHCHTVKHSWGHLQTSPLSYRRPVKASGAAQQDEACLALAQKLWTWRGSLLKQPGNVSAEAKQAMIELANEDEGFVHSFRPIIWQLVHIFDHAHRAAQAQRRLQQLRKDIRAVDDNHLEKMLTFFDDHWEQAMRYLWKKGMGQYRRGSNAESGMRL